MYERSTNRAENLVAVDIGNSQIKLGHFAAPKRSAGEQNHRHAPADQLLPDPIATCELEIDHSTSAFDTVQLSDWCKANVASSVRWFIGSVNRRVAELLMKEIAELGLRSNAVWSICRITYRDLPLVIRVEEPERVGIDRLLAAVAVNWLRQPDRAAIVVDLGTAITVDLVQADGAFAGGAILPGIGMSARALAEQTDALPHVERHQLEKPPTPLGKSTVAAIEAGLFWGAVGAIRELIGRLSAGLSVPPEIFLTGGASAEVAELLAREGTTVRHVPHLVLAGIALVERSRT